MRFSLLLIGLLGIVQNVAGAYVCRNGWIFFHGNGHCYHFGHYRKNWEQAEGYCRRAGGYLVKVNNSQESNWLRYNARKINHVHRARREYWLGATDTYREGQWKWSVDQSPMRYRSWSPRQPDDWRRAQDCALMWISHSYTWDDQECTNPRNYICEGVPIGKQICGTFQ